MADGLASLAVAAMGANGEKHEDDVALLGKSNRRALTKDKKKATAERRRTRTRSKSVVNAAVGHVAAFQPKVLDLVTKGTNGLEKLAAIFAESKDETFRSGVARAKQIDHGRPTGEGEEGDSTGDSNNLSLPPMTPEESDAVAAGSTSRAKRQNHVTTSEDSEGSAKRHKGEKTVASDEDTVANDAMREEKRGRTVFVGCVPLGTKRSELADALGITRNDYETIYFRSIGLHPKFSNDRRSGILSKTFGEVVQTHNAYVVLLDGSKMESVLEKNRMEFKGCILRIQPEKGRKFSKFDRKTTVFVGNLPLTATEDELFRAFESCGAPVASRIIRDSPTGFGKGFGFVCFENMKSAKKAVRQNTKIELKGRSLRVTMAVGRDKAAAEKEERAQRRVARAKTASRHPAQRRMINKGKKKAK